MFLASGVRRRLGVQLASIAVTSIVFFMLGGALLAGSVWFGGAIAAAILLLLEWRRSAADRGPALDAVSSLRLLYRTALERFALAATLFALALGVLRLDPLALLTGFIVGQAALIMTGTGKTE
ncbi:MAG TPA: ATP synthase subunit I [Gammaproteobacteria bacterium]|nr:ATP synthase subunit I [Gammaproteobacteria bacterium]